MKKPEKKKKPLWTPDALVDAFGCHERFLKKHVLCEDAEEMTPEAKVELNLIRNVCAFLKTGYGGFLRDFPQASKEALKKIFKWKRKGFLDARESKSDDTVLCVPDIVYEDRNKYTVIVIKNREDNRIRKEDLTELLMPLYLLQKENYKNKCYIGILAVRNNKKPLNIKKSPLTSIEDLEKFIKQKIEDARNALLTGGHYNKKFCKTCEYPSCPGYSP